MPRNNSKESNRKNNGIKISLEKLGERLDFDSIGEAADYLCILLSRRRVSVYSHLKQLNKGVLKEIGGWRIANT